MLPQDYLSTEGDSPGAELSELVNLDDYFFFSFGQDLTVPGGNYFLNLLQRHPGQSLHPIHHNFLAIFCLPYYIDLLFYEFGVNIDQTAIDFLELDLFLAGGSSDLFLLGDDAVVDVAVLLDHVGFS